jgi:hypothetical protein
LSGFQYQGALEESDYGSAVKRHIRCRRGKNNREIPDEYGDLRKYSSVRLRNPAAAYSRPRGLRRRRTIRCLRVKSKRRDTCWSSMKSYDAAEGYGWVILAAFDLRGEGGFVPATVPARELVEFRGANRKVCKWANRTLRMI